MTDLESSIISQQAHASVDLTLHRVSGYLRPRRWRIQNRHKVGVEW
jgi:hypothetical protein